PATVPDGSGDPGTPKPAADTVAPLARVTVPACAKGITAKRCAAQRSRPAAWKTLRGTVADRAPSSGIQSVAINFVRRTGKTCAAFDGSRFRTLACARATQVWVRAALKPNGRWTRAVPALGAGRYSLRVRAVDAAGNAQKGFPAGSVRSLVL